MREYDSITRLKKMEQTEIALCKQELQFVKRIASMSFILKKLKDNIKNERISRDRKEYVEKLQQTNAKLRMLVKEKEADLDKCNEEILKCKADCATLIEKYIKDTENRKTTMDRLHTLRRVCNIYINEKALPDFVQGMSIQEVQDEKHWVPFRLAINEVNKRYIPESLWSIAHQFNLYSQQWDYLICGNTT